MIKLPQELFDIISPYDITETVAIVLVIVMIYYVMRIFLAFIIGR